MQMLIIKDKAGFKLFDTEIGKFQAKRLTDSSWAVSVLVDDLFILMDTFHSKDNTCESIYKEYVNRNTDYVEISELKSFPKECIDYYFYK